MKTKYVFFDGDNVGNTIEILLLENKIKKAKQLSEAIALSFKKIKERIESKAEILLIGGDDLLIKVTDKDIDKIVEEVRQIFTKQTELTISCGIGDNIESSIYQLRLAKLYGKNQVKKEENV